MRLDVRTRLFIVAIFSVLALIWQEPLSLAVLLGLNLLTLVLFRIPANVFVEFRKYIYTYLVLIVIQSLFVRSGETLLCLGRLTLLTTGGLIYGVSIILRFLILAGSGLILVNCQTAELLLGLVKLRLPYEIVFMIQLGIRFIPVFFNELQNIFSTIQLRGVDLRKVYKRKVLRVYVGIFTPLIYSIWQKAEHLSILLELRGFRRFTTRSYYRDLSMSGTDYAVIGLVTAATVLLFLLRQRFFV